MNKKGFTLIELLAVIVILAVVMVVTIPSVLKSMSRARLNQYQNAADTVADWLTKQYEAASMDAADQVYLDWNRGIQPHYGDSDGRTEQDAILTPEIVEAAGISNAATDFCYYTERTSAVCNSSWAWSYAYYNEYTGKVCVGLKLKKGSSFATNSNYFQTVAKSAGCDVCHGQSDSECSYDLYRTN